MEAQGVLVPSLSLEMLRVLSQTGAVIVHVDPAGDGVQSVAIRGLEIPTDERGQIFVHFNKSDPARYVSAKDVLQRKLSTDRLRGQLVLIGTSAIGLFDLKTTPVEAVMPGVEVHAQILESVLTRSLLVNPAYAIGADRRGARRLSDRRPDRPVVVFVRRPQPADRFHLSADLELADLSGVH